MKKIWNGDVENYSDYGPTDLHAHDEVKVWYRDDGETEVGHVHMFTWEVFDDDFDIVAYEVLE